MQQPVCGLPASAAAAGLEQQPELALGAVLQRSRRHILQPNIQCCARALRFRLGSGMRSRAGPPHCTAHRRSMAAFRADSATELSERGFWGHCCLNSPGPQAAVQVVKGVARCQGLLLARLHSIIGACMGDQLCTAHSGWYGGACEARTSPNEAGLLCSCSCLGTIIYAMPARIASAGKDC